jgi:hypothetical protein
MKTVLITMKIITKFVKRLTFGIQLLSMLLFGLPDTFNQQQVMNTISVYKVGYDNSHPMCTISHKVKAGPFQLLTISFV